ncbi:hypothetical protein DMH15_16470 [Streptomyces sp. WAC 06725]|nr:hypothetical protein DMH15_16470 [Streptomyces sp. WAC 06725]
MGDGDRAVQPAGALSRTTAGTRASAVRLPSAAARWAKTAAPTAPPAMSRLVSQDIVPVTSPSFARTLPTVRSVLKTEPRTRPATGPRTRTATGESPAPRATAPPPAAKTRSRTESLGPRAKKPGMVPRTRLPSTLPMDRALGQAPVNTAASCSFA